MAQLMITLTWRSIAHGGQANLPQGHGDIPQVTLTPEQLSDSERRTDLEKEFARPPRGFYQWAQHAQHGDMVLYIFGRLGMTFTAKAAYPQQGDDNG